jgi:hypothetical protein
MTYPKTEVASTFASYLFQSVFSRPGKSYTSVSKTTLFEMTLLVKLPNGACVVVALSNEELYLQSSSTANMLSIRLQSFHLCQKRHPTGLGLPRVDTT